MDWFYIAWIAGTVAVIVYAVWNLNRELQRCVRAIAYLKTHILITWRATLPPTLSRVRLITLRKAMTAQGTKSA